MPILQFEPLSWRFRLVGKYYLKNIQVKNQPICAHMKALLRAHVTLPGTTAYMGQLARISNHQEKDFCTKWGTDIIEVG